MVHGCGAYSSDAGSHCTCLSPENEAVVIHEKISRFQGQYRVYWLIKGKPARPASGPVSLQEANKRVRAEKATGKVLPGQQLGIMHIPSGQVVQC